MVEDLCNTERSKALALLFQLQSLSQIEKTFNKQRIETADMNHQSECPDKSLQTDLQLKYNSQVSPSQSFVFHIGFNNLDEMSSPRVPLDDGKNLFTDNLPKSHTEIFPTLFSISTQGLYSVSQKSIHNQLPLAVSLLSTSDSQGVSLKSKA